MYPLLIKLNKKRVPSTFFTIHRRITALIKNRRQVYLFWKVNLSIFFFTLPIISM